MSRDCATALAEELGRGKRALELAALATECELSQLLSQCEFHIINHFDKVHYAAA